MKRLVLIVLLLTAASTLNGCIAVCDEFGDVCVAYAPPPPVTVVEVVEVAPCPPVEVIEVVPVPPRRPCPGRWPYRHRRPRRYPWH